MDRADYLETIEKDPWAFPAVDGCPTPPPEWVAAAWDLKSVQESIAYDMVRDVSKNGEISRRHKFLVGLSTALSTEQVVRLFHAIRDESPHREEEFRPQFARGFARHSNALPPPLTREEVIAALGRLGFDEDIAVELMDEGSSNDGHHRCT